MTTIQSPVPGAKLRTEFKTREPIEIFLHPGIAPVVVVSDLSGPAVGDRGYPRSARGLNVVAAGGAGTNAQAVCVGTAGLGLIFNVTSVTVSKATAGSFRLNYSLGAAIAGLTDETTKAYDDQRISEIPPGLSIQNSTPLTAAIDGSQVAEFLLEAIISKTIPLNVVLGGGDFVLVASNTTNESMLASWEWTEYQLEDR